MKTKEKRQQTEAVLQHVVDTFDEPAFVVGMDDYRIIMANKKFAQLYGEEWKQAICWKQLRKDQHAPCEDCTNPLLVNKNKKPTGIVYSAFKSDVTEKWYQCADQAFEWTDNRLVALKTAQDVTDLKETAEKNRTLLEQNKALTGQVIHILDDERQKLARYLHDEIGQISTGIKMNADYLLMEGEQKGREQDEIDTIEDIRRQSMQLLILLKQICTGLDPFTVSHALTLQEMLEGMFTQWLTRNRQISGQIRIEKDAVLDSVDHTMKVTFYHVLQEALTNISKHAQATQVDVQCYVEKTGMVADENKLLTLLIDDNGKGLSEAHVGTGLGLIYMKERIAVKHGRFAIETSPIGGVRIKAQLPVRRSQLNLSCPE